MLYIILGVGSLLLEADLARLRFLLQLLRLPTDHIRRQLLTQHVREWDQLKSGSERTNHRQLELELEDADTAINHFCPK